MRRGRILIGLIVAVVGVLLYFSKTEINPVTGEKQRVALSPEQETAMGLQARDEMAAELGGIHPDEEVQRYLETLGERIVASSAARGSGYQYDFHLLADPQTVNAFALPGGQIFITAGLLKRLQNEAQLAGVLGHETGHVVARHSSQQLAKQQFTQILIGAAGVAASSEESSGREAAAVAAMVGQMINMRYGREDELEADTLGVRFMGESGFDPRALIDVMRILAEASGGSPQPEFLSTHPDPGNRSETIQAEIARLYPQGIPSNLTLGDSGTFERVKARL